MQVVTVSEARKRLKDLIARVVADADYTVIFGRNARRYQVGNRTTRPAAVPRFAKR